MRQKRSFIDANPLELRVTRCPACNREHLVNASDLPLDTQCRCRERFCAADHLVLDASCDMPDCYATWRCPKCSKKLLVPRYAVDLPGRCPCGHDYPTRSKTGLACWTFDTLEKSFIGNDPYLSENMLIALRAAQKYDYDVSCISENFYQVHNPTKGTSYLVELSADFLDQCDCEVFQGGCGTCIHIEHVRLKQNLPSTAQALLDNERFAYAWFDKSSLPPRIRIGWLGDIERDVCNTVQPLRNITGFSDLEALQIAFKKKGIPFRTMLSAAKALKQVFAYETSNALADLITEQGRSFLSNDFPELYEFQVDGALFLASAQRALLLDEMGLGKTVQAIAAACLLRELGEIESCLIIAPKSVLPHWKSEIARFACEECTLIQSPAVTRKNLYRSQSLFKVVTLDTFRRDFPEVGQHDLIIVDEVHKVRSTSTKSSRVIREYDSRFFFGLSGTAIEKSLEDLYGILRAVRPPALESELEFCSSHLVCDGFGKARHTLHPEFFFLRHGNHILRRLKSDTETEIPEIHIEQVDLPLSPLQEEIAQPLLAEIEELGELLKKRYDINDFNRHRWLVNRIVELSDSSALIDPNTNSSSKLEWLKDFLDEKCIRSSEKVVIFTRWVRVQELIIQLCDLMGIMWRSLSGNNSTEERQLAINEFTQDAKVLVFVSTDAGGIGVNLQEARTIVNFEPAWNPSTDAQRIQRVHRIGQTQEVYAYLPLTCLDYQFTLSTHPRKAFSADRLDRTGRASPSETVQTWEELLPVIHQLRREAEKLSP